MLNEQLKLSVMETASSINPPAEPTECIIQIDKELDVAVTRLLI
jgi:hypothetical protein